MITWDTSKKIDEKSLVDIINNYLASKEYNQLDMYSKYYESLNPEITGKYQDRRYRGKTPNNYVPTAYYSTVVDAMAGYMFSNVQYLPKSQGDIIFADNLNAILEDNNNDVKDMKTGMHALAYNKGIELVYTTGDGQTSFNVRYTTLNPRNVILVYSQDIEPELYCAIRIGAVNTKDTDYKLDVIYKDEWQYYKMKDDKIVSSEEPRPLFFEECPVILYQAEMMNNNSPFHKVLPYIDALDYLVTGNSNEIERLVDALLVIGKMLKEEDLEHMDEWKTLEGMKKEDKAEYLTKDMSPAFREYVSKLLINEIHKHSHVIDWYSADGAVSAQASAKALRTRLFDMDMFSNRIEKIYKEGAEKRIRLITKLMEAGAMGTGDIDIVYKRTTPDDFEDLAPILNQIAFLSDATKIELLGMDAKQELEKLEEQKEANAIEVNFEDEQSDELE